MIMDGCPVEPPSVMDYEPRPVTTANFISLFRILLVPVFVGCAVAYGQSVAEGLPERGWRWATIAIFSLAAISDAVDGYIARHWNQQTRLGAILDPLADKLLMLSAILVLSFTPWPQKFPLWFPVILISRDVLSVAGAFVIQHVAGQCQIKAHWIGKVTTVCQIVALLWVMLDIRTPPALWSATVAAALTLASGMVNLANGIKQLSSSPHA